MGKANIKDEVDAAVKNLKLFLIRPFAVAQVAADVVV